MWRKTTRWALLLVLGTLFGGVGSAGAQIFTPTFLAPRTSGDVGVYLSDGPGELAVEGIWRRRTGGYDLGLRVGVADTREDASLLLGGELRSPLSAGTAPLDLAITAGAQAVIGQADGLGAQLGLSLGRTFAQAPLSFTPYVHPRIALVDPLGSRGDADLDILADLGIDLGISPGLILRLGVAFEQPGAGVGIGLSWR